MRFLAIILTALAFTGCATDTRHSHSTSLPSKPDDLDPRKILEQAGVAGVTNAVVVAQSPTQERAIVTGRRAAKHVVVVAYRHPFSDDRPWRVSFIQFKLTDRCLWVVGEREYDVPPTRSDIDKLLAELSLGGPPKDFVFTGDLR